MMKRFTFPISLVLYLLGCGDKGSGPEDTTATDESGLSSSGTGDDAPCDCLPDEVCTNIGRAWECGHPGEGLHGATCSDGTDCESGVCVPFLFFKHADCLSLTCCASLCPCTVTEVCTDLGPVEVCREG
jgi:hypothetical protein